MITVEPIDVPGLPANNATYSQVTRLGDILFVSGQLGIVPGTRELITGGIKEQTRQAIDNLSSCLAAAGSRLERVAKVTIYLTDFSLLSEMNEVYGTRFPQRPAKSSVEVSRLDKGALIEIEVVAGI